MVLITRGRVTDDSTALGSEGFRPTCFSQLFTIACSDVDGASRKPRTRTSGFFSETVKAISPGWLVGAFFQVGGGASQATCRCGGAVGGSETGWPPEGCGRIV